MLSAMNKPIIQRARAYHNAALTVTGLGCSLQSLVAQGEDLTELPGIGTDHHPKERVEIIRTGWQH